MMFFSSSVFHVSIYLQNHGKIRKYFIYTEIFYVSHTMILNRLYKLQTNRGFVVQWFWV